MEKISFEDYRQSLKQKWSEFPDSPKKRQFLARLDNNEDGLSQALYKNFLLGTEEVLSRPTEVATPTPQPIEPEVPPVEEKKSPVARLYGQKSRWTTPRHPKEDKIMDQIDNEVRGLPKLRSGD